jgi:hypothetical protein
MCRKSGANFEVDTLHFKSFIINPANSQKNFVIWDPSHMIKLAWNVLGDTKIIVDGNGRRILWEHICQLNNLQKEEGLHAANKLTQKHINFTDNRMNVKLAAQTLSESVTKSLSFVKNIGLPQFEACTATAKFCQNVNDASLLYSPRSFASRGINYLGLKNVFSTLAYNILLFDLYNFLQFIFVLKGLWLKITKVANLLRQQIFYKNYHFIAQANISKY